MIGVIAIVLGALGCLQGLWSVVGSLVSDAFLSMMPANAMPEMEAMQDVLRRARPGTIVLGLLVLAVAVLLIVGGARLLGRRPQGARLLVTYAWLRLPVVLLSAGFAYWQQKAMFEAMQQMQGGGGMPANLSGAMAFGQAAFVALWGAAWPVFLLIWFGRGKIKDEVAGWSSGVLDGRD